MTKTKPIFMENKTMMLVQATWNEQQTFRMIPISESCPYVECIFDPATKVFVIISKITKVSLHMLPKMDENGDPVACKAVRANGRNFKEERNKIEVFQEYYVEDKVGVEQLIKLTAINADTFDFKAFMTEDKK
jgi:hypothetical protein